MATRHSEIEDQDNYTMRSDPRGHCIIMNNVHFWTGHPSSAQEEPQDHHVPPNRTGSNIDALSLQQLFSGYLKFAVTRRDDVTREQMHEMLIEYQEMDHSAYDALFVIILSHGDEGDIIYTSDDEMIKVNDIVKYFSASKCPSLSNKPKVFIIQACRGSEHNNLVMVNREQIHANDRPQPLPLYDSGYSTSSLATPALINVPDEADTLYAYATIDNHTALRDRKNGSWFIQELVRVIKDHAHDTHLLDMLTMVNNRISLCHMIDDEVQVSQTKSSLRKRLYFHPRPPLKHTQSEIDVPRDQEIISNMKPRISLPAMTIHERLEHPPHGQYYPNPHPHPQYLHHNYHQYADPRSIVATPEPLTEHYHPSCTHKHEEEAELLVLHGGGGGGGMRESALSLTSLTGEGEDGGLFMKTQSYSVSNSRAHSPLGSHPFHNHLALQHSPPLELQTVNMHHLQPPYSPYHPSPYNSRPHSPQPQSSYLQPLPPIVDFSPSPLPYEDPMLPLPQPGGGQAVSINEGPPSQFLTVPQDYYSNRRCSTESHCSVKSVYMTYHMSDDAVIPQGYCIIINNNTDYYDDEKMKEIRGVFSDQLGFHVQVYSDLTRKGIKHLLETVANVDHSDLYCFVVIVLSKGEKESAIYGSDGKKLQLKELMMWFSSDASPTLEEKPKLFFTETQMNEISDTQPVENPKIRDTYTASYYGGLSENKSFTLELAEILSKKCHFVFRNAMEELAASHETNQSLYLYNNLHRLLHFNMCSEIRDSYNEGKQVIEEIKLATEMLVKLREATVTELERIKEDIFDVCQKTRRSRMAGAITSLVGGGLAAVGFGLIPVTFGGSIALSVIGAGVGVAGGAVSIASTVTDKVMSKGKLKQAQAIVNIDKQLTEQVNDLFIKLHKILESIQRKDPSTTREQVMAVLLQGHHLLRVGAVAARSVHIARTVIQGSVFALKVAGPAARGIAVVGGVATVLTIPLDLYELISNSVKLYKKSDTDATKWFNEQLALLRKQQKDIEQINEELQRDKPCESEV